jgi:hypothetical protein
MELLANNWSNVLGVIILIGGWLILKGKKDEKMQQVIDTVGRIEKKHDTTADKLEKKIDQAISDFDDHINDEAKHISPTLLELFKLRHDYTTKELGDTRADIRRVEELLNGMR